MLLKSKTVFSVLFLLVFSLESYSNDDIDTYHREITKYIQDKSVYLDKIVGDYDENSPIINNSYAILNIKQNFHSKSPNKLQVDLNLKIDLPYTKKTWKIFLDTSNTDFNSLEEKTRETFTSNSNFIKDSGGTTGGLIFADLTKDWKRKYRLGVRLDLPLDPFMKANFYHISKVGKDVTQYFDQEFFLYNGRGAGVKSRLDYFYKTQNNVVFQSNTSAQFLEKQNNNWELTQKFSRWERIGSRSTLKYSIGVSRNRNKINQSNNYWINTVFRQKIYKEWVFLKVIPEISFHSMNDYKPNYGIVFKLEVYFAKKKNLPRLTMEY
jgi:hypothetical protein